MFRVSSTNNKPNYVYIQGALTDNYTDEASALVFQNFNSNMMSNYNMASMSMINTHGDGIGALIFKTNPNGGNKLAEGMRLDSTGYLGIGTSSNNIRERLTVAGNTVVNGQVASQGMVIGPSTLTNDILTPLVPGYQFKKETISTTTTSSALSTKTTLNVNVLPGTYRIGLWYKTMGVQGGDVRVQVAIDDTDIVYDETYITNTDHAFADLRTYTVAGSHKITLSYSSPDNMSVGLSRVFVEFWKVG